MGLRLWDVRFEKEGSGWYLRYFIDKPGGVCIDDCERFSRAVDPLLDEADPIEQSYCLEVSSPGVERELTRPWHFEENLGRPVTARLISPRGGVREFSGTLLRYADNQPKDYPTTKAAEYFAQLVEERTGGQIRIRVYADAALGDEISVFRQLQFGGIDFARASVGTLAGFVPEMEILQLPYLFADNETIRMS